MQGDKSKTLKALYFVSIYPSINISNDIYVQDAMKLKLLWLICSTNKNYGIKWFRGGDCIGHFLDPLLNILVSGICE